MALGRAWEVFGRQCEKGPRHKKYHGEKNIVGWGKGRVKTESFKFLMSDCGDTVSVHFSDGRVKYILNKNSIKLDIPLPLSGKSSKDLKIPETVRTPALNFKSMGVQLPSQVFQLPTFTIPKTYQLQVPLLGVLDLSTNVYSNLYNWSASYTGGNTSKDHFSLRAQYRMKADSAVDLFSYSVQGEACSGKGSIGLIDPTFRWDSSRREEFRLSYK